MHTHSAQQNKKAVIPISKSPVRSQGQQFLFFYLRLSKRLLTVSNRESEQHLWILHIQISLGTKFNLNWQFWFFRPNLPKKGVSNLKQKKVNSAIEFCIFKLVYNHLHKILEKLRKLRKSSNHKRNINIIYNKKLHHKCLQRLPNLICKT